MSHLLGRTSVIPATVHHTAMYAGSAVATFPKRYVKNGVGYAETGGVGVLNRILFGAYLLGVLVACVAIWLGRFQCWP